MCATMATNLVELRHFDSRRHFMIRNTLVKRVLIKIEVGNGVNSKSKTKTRQD